VHTSGSDQFDQDIESSSSKVMSGSGQVSFDNKGGKNLA